MLPARTSTGRNVALDGLRGIAILLVLSFHWVFASLPGWHSPDLTTGESIARHATMLNWIGVDLFFVLSGFLIGGIILDNRRASNFFSVFYTRRAFRILPLYFLLLGVVAVGDRFIPWHQERGLRVVFDGMCQSWTYLTFTQNFHGLCRAVPPPDLELYAAGLGNTWSLAIEEQFYLLAPALLYRLPFRRVPAVLVGGIVLALAARIYCFFIADIDTYTLLPTRMDTLLVGVLCAWAVRDEVWSARLQRNLPRVRAAAGAMLLILVVFIVERWSAGHRVMESLGFTMVALLGGCCVLIAQYGPPGFLSYRPLRLFGTGSYCIYLFHRPVGMLMHWLVLGHSARSPYPESIVDLAGIGVTLASLGLVCGIAWFTWHVIEAPALRIGHLSRYSRASEMATVRSAA